MKSVPFVTILVTILCYFGTDIADAQAKEKSCKAVIADLTKRQLGGISACVKSMKFKNGKEKSKKMNCILKCVLEKEGVFPTTGVFTQEHVDALLLREFPESLLDKANRTVAPCVEMARTTKLDPDPVTDEYCKTYDAPLKCLMGSLPNLCAP